MQAFVHRDEQLHQETIDVPELKAGEVVVNMKVAGLNRRDLYIENLRKGEKDPLVLGSDGTGVIEAVGSDVSSVSVGDEVIINPALNWFTKSAAPPEDFEILGMPDHGTFAEKIVISHEQIEKKPDFLTWVEAGVLGLAGLTGYRAMFTRGNLQPGETVFIPGAGSGVATFLISFAKHQGARVIVTSRSEEKREKALQLGANLAIDTNSDWQEVLKDETIDLVIESVGDATFNRSLDVLKPGGTIVVFGATTDDMTTLNLREFFYGQYNLLGSTMGSREEFNEMLAFVEKHSIRPVIDQVVDFKDIAETFQYLEDHQQFGKIAIQID